jgi:hypothetical protein
MGWGGPPPANRPCHHRSPGWGSAAGVTPCRGDTGKVSSGSTVRDYPAHAGWGSGAARDAGGDGERRGNITMPDEPAMRAGHYPAPRFGDLLAAGRAGRRGAPFVDQMHPDPGQGGLVGQDVQGAADLPLPQPQVVPPPGRLVEDSTRVADGQGADPGLDSPVDHGFGGFVQGLPDPAAVPALDQPGAPPRCATAGTRAHPGWGRGRRRRGGGFSCRPGAGGVRRGSPQQGHRPDCLGRVGHRPVETDKQRRTSPCRGKPNCVAGQGERAVVPADRHQRASPPRIAHLERPGLASGGRENHASENRRSTDRAPVLSNSPNTPGPDSASRRHSS